METTRRPTQGSRDEIVKTGETLVSIPWRASGERFITQDDDADNF